MFTKDSETQICIPNSSKSHIPLQNSLVPWALCNCMPIVVGIDSSLHKYRCSLGGYVWYSNFSRYNI